MKHPDIQRQYVLHFNSLRGERDPTTGKRKDSHGRCLFYRMEVIAKSNLIGCLKDSDVNALAKHMNLNHSTSLAPLERRGKLSNN